MFLIVLMKQYKKLNGVSVEPNYKNVPHDWKIENNNKVNR